MNTKEIDLCISTLSGMKVGQEAFASAEAAQQLRKMLAQALDCSVQSPMGKAIAAAILAG